ncbi:ubiquitin family domain-containing protein [Phthorimaea operculella]|nr:ubiquitin family domain-containing protein [Phthorimaea operculella]
MESQQCVFLGIKVKPGPIERHKLDNYTLDHTVDSLKTEAEKKANLPSDQLELIHHGKILKGGFTLQDSGVKNGEMIHVVKKKVTVPPPAPAPFSDAELQQLNASLRTLGCTPNAPGWTRAMQLLNDESAMNEILEAAPSLNDDCVALSILHEVELLAALGANLQSMRRGADAHPALPHALTHLTRLVRARDAANTTNDNVPTSGFAYSLEALSDDEEAEEEETEEGAERTNNPITQEQLAAALQAATEAVSSSTSSRGGGGGTAGARGSQDSLLRLLQAARDSGSGNTQSTPTSSGAGRAVITPEMFSSAITEAINRAGARDTDAPMDQAQLASSSGGSSASQTGGEFSAQLQHMHEMGLLDDAINVRALLIAGGDVNAAINLVFSGAIGDD